MKPESRKKERVIKEKRTSKRKERGLDRPKGPRPPVRFDFFCWTSRDCQDRENRHRVKFRRIFCLEHLSFSFLLILLIDPLIHFCTLKIQSLLILEIQNFEKFRHFIQNLYIYVCDYLSLLHSGIFT